MELVGWWRRRGEAKGGGSTSGVVHGGKKLTRTHRVLCRDSLGSFPSSIQATFRRLRPLALPLFPSSDPLLCTSSSTPPAPCSNTTCFLRHPPPTHSLAQPSRTASQASDCCVFSPFPSTPPHSLQPTLLIILQRIRVALYLIPHLLSSPTARLYIDPP